MTKKLLATSLGNLEPPGGTGLMEPDFIREGLFSLEKVISLVVGILTVFGGIYFIFVMIIGAYNWIGSSGDKQKLQKARDMILHALIGLIVLIAAYGIVSLAGYIFGFCILQPASVLNIWPI